LQETREHCVIGDAGGDRDAGVGREGAIAGEIGFGDEGGEGGAWEGGGDVALPGGEDLFQAAIGLAGEDGGLRGRGAVGWRAQDICGQAVGDDDAGTERQQRGGSAGLVGADEDRGWAVTP
jgi:hypothetical protein